MGGIVEKFLHPVAPAGGGGPGAFSRKSSSTRSSAWHCKALADTPFWYP